MWSPSSLLYTLQRALQNCGIRTAFCSNLFGSSVAFLLNRMVIVASRPTPLDRVWASRLAQPFPKVQILLLAVSPALGLNHILGIGKNLDITGILEGLQPNRGRDNFSLIVGAFSEVLPDDPVLLLALLINVYENSYGTGPRRPSAIS